MMKTIRKISCGALGAAVLMIASSAWAQITINEFVDDERTASAGQVFPDTREFVELYNAGGSAVDISGWKILAKQIGSNFGMAEGIGVFTYTLPAASSIPAGGFFVMRAPGVSVPGGVPTYEPAFPAGKDMLPDGAAASSTNGNFVLELRNTSDVLVDAVADETFRGTERANLTAEQIAQTAGGWWGQDPSFNLASSNNVLFSNGRYSNGADTNNNGYDFGMLPVTPGASNNLPVNAVHTIPNVDSAGLEDEVTQYYASFVMGRAIDPTNGDGNVINPSSTGVPSPQGGKAIIAYDETGGGNAIYSKEIVRKFDLYAYIQTGAIGTTAAADVQDHEASVYGIGTTDGLFGTPNPAGLNTTTSSQNGSTGYGWMIQRVEDFNGGSPTNKTYLMLIDFGDSGDSIASDNEWQVMKLYDLSAAASGWHRLSIEYDPVTGIVTAKHGVGTGALETITFTESGDFDNNGTVDAGDYAVWRKRQGTTNVLPNDGTGGTIGTAQYNEWRAQYGNSKTPGLKGTFYVGYRENIINDGTGNTLAGSRPPTFDMIGGGGFGSGQVPEPGTIGLAAIGLLFAASRRRR
jgi:lamin tail-like protein/PEP-CTERM motif-containing protein